MKTTSRFSKLSPLLKWAAGIVLVLLVLCVGAITWLNKKLEPIVAARLRNAVIKGSDSLYRLDFTGMDIRLFSGKVLVSGIQLSADSTVYARQKALGTAPAHLFTLSGGGIVLGGLHPFSAYFRKKLDLDSIVIEQPRITDVFNKRPDSAKTGPRQSVYSRISGVFRSLHVGSIVIHNASFNYRAGQTGVAQVIPQINIRVTDLLIDSLSDRDTSRFYFTKDIFVQVKNYRYRTADRLYTLRLGELAASTGERSVYFTDVQLIPRDAPMAFSKRFAHQKDWYRLTIKEIGLKNIDLQALDSRQQLRASSLTLTGADLKTFLSRSLPPPPIDKWVNFPHVLLRKLPPGTRVDTVSIRRSRVEYSEFNPKSGQIGVLSFSDFGGTISRVTNDSAALAKNHHARASLRGKLLGKTPLSLRINFDLTDPAAAFTYSGEVGQLNLPDLNPMNRALSLAEVKSGVVKRAAFTASANRYGVSGTLDMVYTDLKVSLLKKDDTDGTIRKKGLLSLVANAALVINDNPSKGESLRKGDMKFVRPPNSSFFNLIWKGIFSGIKQTIGLGMIKDKSAAKAKEIKK